MKYRFFVKVYNSVTGLLFSTEINGDSVQEVAAYYLGRYFTTELPNGKEQKERMERIEFISQLDNV